MRRLITNKFPVTLTLLTALGLVFYGTTWGPWAFRDSAAFLEAGRNLAAGRGLVIVQASGDIIPFTKQPPLYPLLLSGFVGLNFDIVEAVRWLNIICLLSMLVLISWQLRKYIGQQWFTSIIILLFLSSYVVLYLFTSFLSEPLYLFLLVGSLIFLNQYHQTRRKRFLLMSWLQAVLGSLTRFAGVVPLFAIALSLLLDRKSIVFERLRLAGLFFLTGLVPVLIWVLVQFGAAGDSPIRLSDLAIAELWEIYRPFRAALVDAIWGWIPLSQTLTTLAYRSKIVIIAILFVCLALAILYIQNRWRRSPFPVRSDPMRFAFILLSAAFLHLLFLLIGTPISPWEITMDDRQLAPSYILVVTAVFLIFFSYASASRQRQWILSVLLVFSGTMLVSNLQGSFSYLEDMHLKGRGYTSEYWQNAPILEEIERIPQGVTLISNEPEAINFLLDRRAYWLPELQTKTPIPIEEPFGGNSQDPLNQAFRQDKAALILFAEGNSQFFPLYGERTPERLSSIVVGLDHQYERRDGGIYWYSPDHP